MDIREKTRKEITTPGGYKVIIRKLNLFSFMETGTIPDIFAAGGKTTEKELTRKIQQDPGSLKRILKISLVEGVVGGDLNIVDKSPKECDGDELSYQEVPQDDAVAIINSVLVFSDMTGGGAVDKARPFPKKKR
jgi:hypothetical protein